MKSLPNSHQYDDFDHQKVINTLNKDTNIILICLSGIKAMLFAYRLSHSGFKNIHVLAGGLIAWKKAHHQLYRDIGSNNVVKVDN